VFFFICLFIRKFSN